VYALSDLLRNNLRDIDKLRKMEEEIKSIQDYLVIQKTRFGDRIRDDIQIEPEIMQASIPALTLQPLVENSIIHGLEGKSEGGQITISGYLKEGNIYIEVGDTGIGLTQGQIDSIFQKENRRVTKGQTTGLGILNVHKRIRHLFGNDYGLTMESTPGKGTTVFVKLPYYQD
jgi:sensor histidine kinase YesM